MAAIARGQAIGDRLQRCGRAWSPATSAAWPRGHRSTSDASSASSTGRWPDNAAPVQGLYGIDGAGTALMSRPPEFDVAA
jgi:hypothetical protein